MKRKFAILLSAMLLTQAVCGCGGAGFFGHVFRFGFNGQHRKQIERKSGDRDG